MVECQLVNEPEKGKMTIQRKERERPIRSWREGGKEYTPTEVPKLALPFQSKGHLREISLL